MLARVVCTLVRLAVYENMTVPHSAMQVPHSASKQLGSCYDLQTQTKERFCAHRSVTHHVTLLQDAKLPCRANTLRLHCVRHTDGVQHKTKTGTVLLQAGHPKHPLRASSSTSLPTPPRQTRPRNSGQHVPPAQQCPRGRPHLHSELLLVEHTRQKVPTKLLKKLA